MKFKINWKIVFLSVFLPFSSLLAVILIVYAGITSFNGGMAYAKLVSFDFEKSAQLGDALSGIFAGLAFIGVLVTLFIQKNALEKQERTADLQRFETTFFNMISLQQEIVNDLKFKVESNMEQSFISKILNINSMDKRIIVDGRDVFEFAFNNYFKDRMLRKGLLEYSRIDEVSKFDHYFRHLYTILNHIHKADCLSFKEKYNYAKIVRATLSHYELVFLFYNGFFYPKLKLLMEEFTLLKNIRNNLTWEHDISKVTNRDSEILKDTNVELDRNYNLYLTAKKGNNQVYYVGAFYNQKQLKENPYNKEQNC